MIRYLLIILLTLSTLYFGCSYYRLKNVHTYFPTSPNLYLDTPLIIHYTDSQGNDHAVAKDQLTNFSKKEAIKQLSGVKKYVDSAATALGVRSKQIESTTTISTLTQAKNVFLQTQVDSLKKITYVYRDRYLNLNVRPPDPTDSLDTGKFDFSYNADLKIYQYWKRERILGLPIGNRVSYTDISSNDDRTTIKNLKTYTVKQKVPVFGLRGQLRTSYTPATNSFSLGPALRFDIRNISIGATLYFNTQQSTWRPNITADYTVF